MAETHDKRTETHDKRTETHACDLISRQAALDALEKIDCSDGVGISSLKCDAVEDAVTAIKVLPTVDAVPVVHGRWIHGQEVCREYIGITLIMVQYSHWECSVCGYRTEGQPLWKYCPNCGARMDEKDGDQNG
jgi:hypothetical protein